MFMGGNTVHTNNYAGEGGGEVGYETRAAIKTTGFGLDLFLNDWAL